MNKKTTVILVLAGCVGLATAFSIWAWMQKRARDFEKDLRNVVVAVVPLKAYTQIDAKMVRLMSVPQHAAADKAASSLQQVVGKVVIEPYKEKDQIRLTGLTTKDKVPGLSYVIPEGKRAITIKVDEVKGVGYSVHPGDRADILATYKDPVTGQKITQIILQRLEVVAIDEAQMDTSKDGKGATKSVTFAVTPEEATKLTVTDMEGALRMVLRPTDDKTVVDLKAIRLRDLVKPTVVPEDSVTLEPPTGQVIGDQEPRKIRVFRGSEPVKEVPVTE